MRIGNEAFQGPNYGLVPSGTLEDELHPKFAPHPNTMEKDFHTQPYSHCLQTPRGYKLPEALRLPAPAQGWPWKKIAGTSHGSKAQRNCDMSAQTRKRDPRAPGEALRMFAVPRYVES